MPPEELTTAQQILQRVVPLVLAVLIAAVSIELIRRRKLREEYAMLWIVASLVLLLFAVWPRLLGIISKLVGIDYQSTMFIISFGFLALMVIHYAVVISRLSEDTRQVSQRMAMLQRKLEELTGEEMDQDEAD